MESALQEIAASSKFEELMLKRGNAPAFLDGKAAKEKLMGMKEKVTPIIDSLK